MKRFATYAKLQAALDANKFRFLPKFGPAEFKCSQCKQYKPLNTDSGSCATGYGISHDRQFICFACCGVNDARDLEERGKGYLYLSSDSGQNYRLSNWPGSLTISLHGSPKRGYHNLARYRYDVWFKWRGFDWHGVQYGDNTQVCHVKRIK